MTIEDFVNVSVRIRPLFKFSQDLACPSSCVQVISKQPAVLLHTERQQAYHFDNIFSDESDQDVVYCDAVKPLVSKVKQGYNCTVFAYGQTGTGKTYTMGTNPQLATDKHAGFIPRTLIEFFSDESDNADIDISVSFIEIYNEKVFDLLNNDNSTSLPVSGFKVQGAKQEKMFNSYDGLHFLELGGKNRHTGETKQNANSSRSHAVFTIHCSRKEGNVTTLSKLNLVDLAGCESIKKTGNQGSTFHEGVNINKGLLCIGQVMTALSHNSSYIPYRQSVITSILKDSLNNKNYISLIACISSNPEDSHDTIQTLEFSQRVKKLRNKPEVNNIISQYKKENPVIFERTSCTSAIKTGLTPFKGSNLNLYQTPLVAKTSKTLHTIREPVQNSINDGPGSLFSTSLSSISNVDSVQQTLSPMIKKYMTQMENSLMGKLQTVIENTVKKLSPKRRINKENTPSRLSWNSMQTEVTRLVRSQILQCTAKATLTASSPIEDQVFPTTRRVLTYESPDKNYEEDEINIDSQILKESAEIFKIPKKSARKRKYVEETHSSPIKKRCSERLKNTSNSYILNASVDNSVIESRTFLAEELLNDSILKTSPIRKEVKVSSQLDLSDNSTIFKFPTVPVSRRQKKPVNHSPVKRRSSVRLQNKKDNRQINESDESFKEDLRANVTLRRSSVRLQMKSNVETMTPINRKTRNISSNNKKNIQDCTLPIKSTRTSIVKLTRSPLKVKAIKNCKITDTDSPITAHSKQVLKILNSGDRRDIEKLHTVGPKTADRILFFRKIKGSFKKISDLLEMPEWKHKRYDSFLSQNFLRDDA